jgi:hypothetical protein
METIKFNRISGERYSTFDEVFEVMDKRDVSKEWLDGDYDSECRDSEAGNSTVTYEESKHDILYGTNRFDNEYEKARKEVETQLMGYETPTRASYNRMDAVGSSVNVGRARTGHPLAFTHRIADRRPRKTVTLFFNVACPWYTESKDRVRNGCVVLAAADWLERSGYSVAINLFPDMSCGERSEGKDILTLEVPVKTYSSPLNARKLQYPLAAKATLFHLGCRWKHRFPETYYQSCEGTAADKKGRTEEVKAYCDSRGGVFLSNSMLCDMYEDGKDAKDVMRYIEKEVKRISQLSR